MRQHRFFAAALAAMCATAPFLSAQAATDPELEAAITRFESVAKAAGADHRAALMRLSEFDDARVTALLLADLSRASGPARVEVLDAIGKRVRAGVLEPLHDLLLATDLTPPVRTAAAKAIARQGNRGIDELIEIVRTDSERMRVEVRLAAGQALAAVDDERAWRGLAPLALHGNAAERITVLRLLAPAREVAAVSQVRLRLLQDPDALIAATAWRQLAAEGHAKARTGFEDLLERLGAAPAPAACAELVDGLAASIWPEAFAAFLRLCTDERPAVQNAAARTFDKVAKDAAFVTWLVREGVESTVPGERRVALQIVSRAAPELVQPLLEKVRQALAHPTPAALETALAFGSQLAKDPNWADDAKRLANAADPAVRTAGLALLGDLGRGDAIELAQRSVTAKEWELRSIAYRYLQRFRALTSIPILIGRVDKEQGRLDLELNNALFALTGVRCFSRGEWESWWRKNKDHHELPAVETVAAAAAHGGGSTVAYYGIPLVSKRTIFLLDVSGSMLQRIGTDKKRTRISEAKRQLRMVVEKLPDDQRFNVMTYEGSVTPLWDRLHQATPAERQAALERVTQVTTGRGGTNIYDALELAFADPDVDTIYLLSDGEPTAGKIVDPGQIADAVKRWNYTRQVVLHTIALGDTSPFLERLAKDSGGQYVVAR